MFKYVRKIQSWKKKNKRRELLKPIGEFPLENVESVKLLAEYTKSIWTLSAGIMTLGIVLLIYIAKDFPKHSDFELILRWALAIMVGITEVLLVISILFSVLAQRNLISAMAMTSELNKSVNWSADNSIYEKTLENAKRRFSVNYQIGRLSFFCAVGFIAVIAFLLALTVFTEISHESDKPKKDEFSIDLKFQPFPFRHPTLR